MYRRHLTALILAAPFVVACASNSSSPTANAPAPNVASIAAPPQPPAAEQHREASIPPVLSARVTTAMKAVYAFDAEFPGLASFHSCVLVFGPEREWVFQCPELAKSPGFEDVHATYRDAPIYSAPSFMLPQQTVPFDKVKMVVGTVAGADLPDEHGGKTKPVPFFLVQDLDSLRAHHPAFEDTSTEEWTAIFVHEYFHVFQLAQPGVAASGKPWLKDGSAREALGKFFDGNSAYRDAVTAEVGILSEGLSSPTKATSKAALTKWLAARDRRMKRLSGTFAKTTGIDSLETSEGFFTFVEGVARYLEVRFLCDRALSRPEMSGDPSFRKFAEFEGCSPTKVSGRDKVSREFYYLIGALVSTHLDAANPDWKKTVFSNPTLLVGEARRATR